MKSKCIDWILDLRYDQMVQPWPWLWALIFKVQYGIRIRYILGQNGLIATKWKMNVSIEQ